MDPIITQLLAQAGVSDSLESYTYVPLQDLESIPLGSHVKFIDRDENIKSGGFLIKTSIKPDRTKTYIILKSNLMYKLYPYYYWIFYKPITHESKVVKTVKSWSRKLLDQELPKLDPTDTNTSTTMNIIIKTKQPKTKTKSNEPVDNTQPNEPVDNTQPNESVDNTQPNEPVDNTQPNEPKPKPKSKTKSKSSSKSSIFKALLESLDKQKV
jgi:hypothetical protein